MRGTADRQDNKADDKSRAGATDNLHRTSRFQENLRVAADRFRCALGDQFRQVFELYEAWTALLLGALVTFYRLRLEKRCHGSSLSPPSEFEGPQGR